MPTTERTRWTVVHRWTSLSLLTIVAASPLAAQEISQLAQLVSAERIERHISSLQGRRYSREELAAAASYIHGEMETYGLAVSREPVFRGDHIVAVLPGTDQGRPRVVVGAHYDTVANSPGADDNASGVAVLLEIARILGERVPLLPVEFIAFSEEESGLVGSSRNVAARRDRFEDVTAAIILDQVAYTCITADCQRILLDVPDCLEVSEPVPRTGNFVGALSNDSSQWVSDIFTRSAERYAPQLPVETARVFGVGRCLSITRFSDHASFWDVGYPSILVTDTAFLRSPHYHRPTDTFETLDLNFARNVAQAVLATVVALATEGNPEPSPTPACCSPTPTPPSQVESLLYAIAPPNFVAGAVLVIDPVRDEQVARITVGQYPTSLGLSPGKHLLQVANFGSRDGVDRGLSTIDLATLTVESSVLTDLAPIKIVITPDERFTFVLNQGSIDSIPTAVLSVHETETNAIVGMQPLGTDIPFDLAIDHVAKRAYVTLSTDAIVELDTDTYQPIDTWHQHAPSLIQLHGGLAYVANWQVEGLVTVVDVATHQEVARILGPRGTTDFAFARDARWLVAVGGLPGPERLAVIDLATLKITSVIDLPPGSRPTDVVLASDETTAYVATCDAGILIVDLAGARVAGVLGGTAVEDVCYGGLTLGTRTSVTWACPGDCDGDGLVTVESIVTLIRAALGPELLTSCANGDRNKDGEITVDEVITAVSTALAGCL